jgi:hypothetical protein
VFWNALIEISAMGHQPSFQTVSPQLEGLRLRVTPPTEGCRLRTAAGAFGPPSIGHRPSAGLTTHHERGPAAEYMCGKKMCELWIMAGAQIQMPPPRAAAWRVTLSCCCGAVRCACVRASGRAAWSPWLYNRLTMKLRSMY